MQRISLIGLLVKWIIYMSEDFPERRKGLLKIKKTNNE